MLSFWIVRQDEKLEMVDGCFEDEPERTADFSINLDAFDRVLKFGLANIASEIGLSYFGDTLIDCDSCKSMLIVLEDIDERLNPSGARTDVRQMKEFFLSAVNCGRSVVVVSD